MALAATHLADLNALKTTIALDLLDAMDQKLEAFRSEVQVAITTATQAATRLPLDGSTVSNPQERDKASDQTDKDASAQQNATSGTMDASKTGNTDGNVADEEDNDDGNGDAAAQYSSTGNQCGDDPPMFMGKFQIRDQHACDRDHALHARADSRPP